MCGPPYNFKTNLYIRIYSPLIIYLQHYPETSHAYYYVTKQPIQNIFAHSYIRPQHKYVIIKMHHTSMTHTTTRATPYRTHTHANTGCLCRYHTLYPVIFSLQQSHTLHHTIKRSQQIPQSFVVVAAATHQRDKIGVAIKESILLFPLFLPSKERHTSTNQQQTQQPTARTLVHVSSS